MKTFIAVALAALAVAMSPATSVRAQEKAKADADAEFLTKVVPGIAASVKIIDYAFDNEVKNGADADLKTYAKNSIIAGNEHLKEARELLANLKK